MSLSHPSCSFEEFAASFEEFFNGNECKDFLDSKGLTISSALNLKDIPDENYEMALRAKIATSPYGFMNIRVSKKGEAQGLVLNIFAVDITFEVKKSDKKIPKEFMETMNKYFKGKLPVGEGTKHAFAIAATNDLQATKLFGLNM